jgi:hypothetical protein
MGGKMGSLLVALVVFICTFGGALLGLYLHARLKDHLDADSREVIKLVMGLIATMSALILGLLIASAESSYNGQKTELQSLSANVVMLDRLLASYGAETKLARDELRGAIKASQERIWSANGQKTLDMNVAASFIAHLQGLSPKTDTGKILQGRALEVAVSVMQTRLLMVEQAGDSLPKPFIMALIFWVSALFLGFGLLTRWNGTVITALIIGAVCVSGAIFMILELSTPYRGIMQISDAPLRHALAQIGR